MSELTAVLFNASGDFNQRPLTWPAAASPTTVLVMDFVFRPTLELQSG